MTRNEFVAAVAHEANRLYCKEIGDDSQPHWEDAPQWQKDSAINGVAYYIQTFGKISPKQSHENWMKVKQSEGWTYGPEKNVKLKQHPCMVPYENLPDNQRTKDTIFLCVVRGFMGPFDKITEEAHGATIEHPPLHKEVA